MSYIFNQKLIANEYCCNLRRRNDDRNECFNDLNFDSNVSIMYMFRLFHLLLLITGISAFVINSKDYNENIPVEIGRGCMPAIAKDSRGIYLVYGIDDSLMYTNSSNNGHSFKKAQLIQKVQGLNASATRGPQIVTTKNGLAVVASTEDGSIYSWVKSAGNEWKKAGKVTDKDSVALEGFVAVASDGNSSLFAVWLDLRNNRKNKIYGARSADGGVTWSKNILVYASPDSTVCECCKPSVVMKNSHVYVMFRNWLHGNRDLHLIQSSDGGRSFAKAVKLGNGNWPLNGCPMDGGGITVARDGIVHTVWNRKGTIYSCEPGKEEKEIGQGRSCTMDTHNGKNVYAWIENKQVVVSNSKGVITNLGYGQSPVLKALDDQKVLCVWENDKQMKAGIVDL
jgi:hypothetical protein